MKYYITNYMNQEARTDLKHLGLYCYSLRSKEDKWDDIATIENNVLVNLYGSIITNEEIELGRSYPNDFLNFNEFESKNEKVDSIAELRDDLEFVRKVNLSNDEVIEEEFFKTFEDYDNYEELEKLTIKKKFRYIVKHYDMLVDYQLVEMGGHNFELYHIKMDNKGDNK